MSLVKDYTNQWVDPATPGPAIDFARFISGLDQANRVRVWFDRVRREWIVSVTYAKLEADR